MPPPVVKRQWVVTFLLSIKPDVRGCFQFVTAAAHQPIAGHDPADDRPMLFNGLAAVFGTPRMHGALTSANRTQMIQRASIEINGSGQWAGAGFVLPMKMAAPAKHTNNGRQKKYAEFI